MPHIWPHKTPDPNAIQAMDTEIHTLCVGVGVDGLAPCSVLPYHGIQIYGSVNVTPSGGGEHKCEHIDSIKC